MVYSSSSRETEAGADTDTMEDPAYWLSLLPCATRGALGPLTSDVKTDRRANLQTCIQSDEGISQLSFLFPDESVCVKLTKI